MSWHLRAAPGPARGDSPTPANDQGLIGDAVLRETSEDAGAYNAIPIQADPAPPANEGLLDKCVRFTKGFAADLAGEAVTLAANCRDVALALPSTLGAACQDIWRDMKQDVVNVWEVCEPYAHAAGEYGRAAGDFCFQALKDGADVMVGAPLRTCRDLLNSDYAQAAGNFCLDALKTGADATVGATWRSCRQLLGVEDKGETKASDDEDDGESHINPSNKGKGEKEKDKDDDDKGDGHNHGNSKNKGCDCGKKH